MFSSTIVWQALFTNITLSQYYLFLQYTGRKAIKAASLEYMYDMYIHKFSLVKYDGQYGDKKQADMKWHHAMDHPYI